MSAKDVSEKIKKIIDDLWVQEITEQDAQKCISEILSVRENRLKVIRGKEKTAVFIRVMGTKRMKTFDNLMTGKDLQM